MKKKIQNKLGTYLAVTAGVGCATSVAEGAIVVVDLSGLPTVSNSITFPSITGDNSNEFGLVPNAAFGYMQTLGQANFFRGPIGGLLGGPRGYGSGESAVFPDFSSQVACWNYNGTTAGGFEVGLNWVAFRDSRNNHGWMSFTLGSLGPNSTNPMTSFGSFVYDPTLDTTATAITLQAAVAAVAVPEPSSLALLALGATGLAARRQRKKAA